MNGAVPLMGSPPFDMLPRNHFAAIAADCGTRFETYSPKGETSRSPQKKYLADDIRDVYAEAKGNGYDVKALRAVVRMRKQDAEKRREHDALVETYAHALGMLADTPLGRAAMRRDIGRQVDLEEAIASKASVTVDLSPTPPVSTADAPFQLPADA